MDSIVREIVTRSGAETRAPESPTQSIGVGAEDAELERILASLRTNIKIVGIGGGGCNTIDRLVESGIVGAELYAANTDAQHLLIIRSPHKLLLGRRVTRGLGAGALPQVGEESAREAADELRSVVQGADMVFITRGLGGGTGTGGAPVLAQLSNEAGGTTCAEQKRRRALRASNVGTPQTPEPSAGRPSALASSTGSRSCSSSPKWARNTSSGRESTCTPTAASTWWGEVHGGHRGQEL